MRAMLLYLFNFPFFASLRLCERKQFAFFSIRILHFEDFL